MDVERWNERHPQKKPRESYVSQCLAGKSGPFVAATDYIKSVPDQIRQWVPGRYVVLGTDGFGRSDSREALRSFFEVDRYSIVLSALKALMDENDLEKSIVVKAIKKLGIDPEKPNPVSL